jgi:hypothetical protein
MEKIAALVFTAALSVLMLGGCPGPRGAYPPPTGPLPQSGASGASGGIAGGAGGGY